MKLSTERVENHSTNLSDIDTRALEAAKHLHGMFLNDNLNGGDTQRLAAVQLFIADVIRETEAEYQISTRTSGKSDDLGLVERIRYRVNNPSAWDSFDQAASDDFASAAAAIERLVAERDEANSAFGSLIVALAQSGLGVRDKTTAEMAAAGDDKCALVVVNRPLEAAEAQRDRLKEALSRQSDNMAFVINHATLYDWADKFAAELEEDRQALKDAP